MTPMKGILNRLFWVCWAVWTVTLIWLYSQDASNSAGPVTFAILAPIALRVIVWFVLRGWPLSR